MNSNLQVIYPATAFNPIKYLSNEAKYVKFYEKY